MGEENGCGCDCDCKEEETESFGLSEVKEEGHMSLWGYPAITNFLNGKEVHYKELRTELKFYINHAEELHRKDNLPFWKKVLDRW